MTRSAVPCQLLIIQPLPSQPDDTSGDELLNLAPDVCVLHVLLKGSRVAPGLLEDTLHDRILEDRHDLHRVDDG